MTDSIVGQDIDSWCIKCKLILAHVVTTMKAEKAHKVQCKTCKHTHVWRAVEPKKRAPKAPPAPPPPSEYERKLSGRDVSKASAYKFSASYAVDELIKHKTLGVGLVTEQIGTTKIGVLFPDGPKLLVCGR